MSNTFYVAAEISSDGNFADCTYYADREGTQPIEGSTLHIPRNAGVCIFEQADTTSLLLIGATFKTIGSVPGMNVSNFTPADDENVISVAMPTNGTVITKGIVLLFSTPGTVQNLYPSSDPQVLNDGPLTC
ncbi:hypothetical protein CDN99_21045 [Roseateles aquatilis]|uniref:Uncharacterized protein n=1 Tax=Roseateles aquatilis TaxID=431061 RepID=A0A246J1I6_9BURK|nr:hypothetical protein [Roseateles aquatilis]OWQ86322.1 hypothetical protein CDN99_21045 [Roseateles aquatilis]